MASFLSQKFSNMKLTNFEAPEFEAEEYIKWTKSYQNLPEDIISKLAEKRERNAFIAETYARNK